MPLPDTVKNPLPCPSSVTDSDHSDSSSSSGSKKRGGARSHRRCSLRRCTKGDSCTRMWCQAVNQATWVNPEVLSSLCTNSSSPLSHVTPSSTSTNSPPETCYALTPSKPRSVLSSSHYVVMASVGCTPRIMTTTPAVLDTGSGYNVIRRDLLPHDWQQYIRDDVELPNLGDANGKQLKLTHLVKLRVRFHNAVYPIEFLIADHLSCPMIIGTHFLNKHVDAIWCRQGRLQLTHDTVQLIGHGTRENPWQPSTP